MATAMIVTMIVLLLLGFPMMVPLIAATLIGFLIYLPIPPDIMIQQMLAGIRPSALIAVPMFILAADIITKGQSADRLIDMVMRFVGHVRGGLGVATAAS